MKRLFLIDPLSAPGLEIDRSLIAGMALSAGLLLGLVVCVVIKAQVKKPRTGAEGLLGLRGKALQNFAESGKVHVNGEIWNAHTAHGLIEKGDMIEVMQLKEGLILEVKKITGA